MKASDARRSVPRAASSAPCRWPPKPSTPTGTATSTRKVDGGEGVLVLVDLYGATPSRLAARLAQLGTPAHRVAGLSLPMLLRVQNYPEQPLDELARTAAAGGRNGVVIDDA